MRAAGGVEVTQLKGQVSGVNAEVYVWLPPQYKEPAYRHHKFPVVELLPGYPGSAKAWFGSLHANEQLMPLMESGRVAPFILVAPRTNLLAGVDTGCANITGTVNADTWLSVDVPKMVMDNFRAEPAPSGWAVVNYSAGAHCAVKLAVAHPDRYRAAVGMSGYNDPIAERNSLAAASPALRAANNPYLLLKAKRTPPPIALYISGESGDGYEAGTALASVAEAPTAVHVVFLPAQRGRAHDGAVAAPGEGRLPLADPGDGQEPSAREDRHDNHAYSSRTVDRRFHARGARQWNRIASRRSTKAVTTASPLVNGVTAS